MSGGLAVDRRTTLAWLAAALAVPETARGNGLEGMAWPDLELTPITGPGYGVDPDLLNPKVPWPLTLNQAELKAAAALCDMILPADGEYSAASAVGVPAFIDEWISAPYPRQQQDRGLIVPGLAWIDAESVRRGGKPFADATEDVRRSICDDVAFAGKVKPGFDKPASFFGLMRRLTLRVYYSTEEGWAQIGYLGNTPTEGPYPGPTPEAMAHIQQLISRTGL